VQELSKNISELEKTWKISLKQTEFGIIEPIFRKNEFKELLKKKIERNWIIETLLLEDKVKLLKTCKTLVMIGCGMYPYSMIATNKKYPNISQIGLDYDKRCVKISSTIIDKCSLSNMKIICSKGEDFDYSNLLDEDLVFISCDVNNIDSIYTKILDTSKAQVFICAPSRTVWLDNYLLRS
jgi:tRNA G46 methylase TrmB